jgi:hypothetical protein
MIKKRELISIMLFLRLILLKLPEFLPSDYITII